MPSNQCCTSLISSHLKCTFSCQSSLSQWLLNRFSWICCIVVSWISLCAGRKNVAFCVHSRFEWVLVHIGTEQLLKHLANKIETGRFHELSQLVDLTVSQNAALLFFSIISITLKLYFKVYYEFSLGHYKDLWQSLFHNKIE